MKPSQFHSNRGWHNWGIYNIGDKFLEKYSKHLKGHLVDLGCGEAPFKKYFLKFADTYTGVDWSNTFHNSAADVVSDLNVGINLDDEIADSIISISVMEHLCEPQIFLNESYRILKFGGEMVLQVPWQWWIHEAPHDYFRYTPYGLKYLFEKAGFTDVHVEAQSGFFTTWIVKMIYFSVRLIRGPKPLRWIVKAVLLPFWTVGQILSPYLDKLDRNWDAETQGYFVLARKK